MNKPKRKRTAAKVCADSVIASIEAGRAKRREIWNELIIPAAQKYIQEGIDFRTACTFARKELAIFST